MAVVKNISGDSRSLFHPDAPPAHPASPHTAGGEACGCDGTVTVNDAQFVGVAWPRSTWELVEGPKPAKAYQDVSTEDAIQFVEKDTEKGEDA